MLKEWKCGLAASLTGLLAGAMAAQPASASETRGYVVSWFHQAAYSVDGDCPNGINPVSEVFVKQYLTEMGVPQDKWPALFKDYPANMYGAIVMRGKVDGKAVNVYSNPESVPDPKISTVVGQYQYGFNLDGKGAASPNSFEDPETHEKGVNNELQRALGCFISERGTPTTRPTWPSITWDITRDQMPAWLIEISGIDSMQSSDNVTVSILRATGPTTRNASGDPQSDMAFRVDSDPRFHNVVHGRIKDGVLTTDRFTFDMLHDPVLGVAEYVFKDAKLRLTFNPDGSIKGILGGYTPWKPIYTSLAVGGSVNELNLSIELPGAYYALKKFADAYPDPKTGENTAISSAFRIEAVPAFIIKPQDNRVSEIARKQSLAFAR